MHQEQISILQALRDALKQRDELSVSLINDNVRLQIHHGHFVKEIIEQRKTLEVAIESLRYSPLSVQDTGIEVIRTLVLINNRIKHLTGEEDLAKKVLEIEKNRN